MAQWLLLEDFAGDIGGPTNVQIAGAGTLLDDNVYNIPALVANGCPLILYNASTMAAPVAAFQKMSGGVAQISPDGNLLALLIAAGAIGSDRTFVHHWGTFAAPTDLPNVTPGGIPPFIPLSELDLLNAGDTAFVSLAYYVCEDEGIAGAGDANWILV